jgi:antitoxin (DNA-binding transcriptional repressor) of toxin-antitoxin stability system
MVESLDVADAIRRLPELLHQVAQGQDEVLISESGSVLAKLVPFTPSSEPRRPGSAIGKIEMLEGFDDPLPDEFMEAFR